MSFLRRIARAEVGVFFIATIALAFTTCGGSPAPNAGESAVIKIDGSSTVFPVTEAVA